MDEIDVKEKDRWSYSRTTCFGHCKYEFYLGYIIRDDEQYLSEGNYYAEVGSYVHVDFYSFIKEADKEITAPPRKLSEQVKRQTELLGYVTIADEKYKRMASVVEIDTKYSPRLKMYSLRNGTTLDCKIDKRTFNKNKLNVGDIVKILGTKEKPKAKKDENGEWVSIPDTKELWITNYETITNL